MKKNYITLILICICIITNAQQETQFSQFFSNKLIQNPAYAGSADVLSIVSLYRQQWTGLKGAPSTQNISLHAPAFGKRVGLGLSILRDDITISENWNILTSYAYRMPLEIGTLSVGLQANVRFINTKWTEVDALDLIDSEIPELNTQQFQPNLAAGIYYQSKKLYLGFSIQNLVSKKSDASTNKLNHLPVKEQHLYLMGGYVFPISKNINFAPAALVRYVRNAPIELDLNASFVFYEKFWTGLSWRKDDSIDLILQYQINQQIRMGIAYDFTISKLKQTTSGSYEVMMQYDFNYENASFRNLRFF